jgi:hypothetical protein
LQHFERLGRLCFLKKPGQHDGRIGDNAHRRPSVIRLRIVTPFGKGVRENVRNPSTACFTLSRFCSALGVIRAIALPCRVTMTV